MSIQKMLSEIDNLQKNIDQKYSRIVTVMFTDLKDSTVFFETHGDLQGRLLVEKHNRLLFPIIEKYNGVVIKTIGDAIMARFDFALEGVKASIEMQRVLAQYNKENRHPIRIRIGLHTGVALVEESDVFGDSVNLAARIEAKTEPGEISISKNTVHAISAFKNIQIKKIGEVNYKGKAESVETYSVLWESSLIEESIRGSFDVKKDIINLEIFENNGLIYSKIVYQDGDKPVLIEREPKRVDFFTQFTDIISSNKSYFGNKTKTFPFEDLKKVGKKIFYHLFENLSVIKNKNSILAIKGDANFMFFPFELLHNGTEFLGLMLPIYKKTTSKKPVDIGFNLGFIYQNSSNIHHQKQEFERLSKEIKDSNLNNWLPKEYNLPNAENIFDNSLIHFAFHNESMTFENFIPQKGTKTAFVVANSCKTVPLFSWNNNFKPFEAIQNSSLNGFIGNYFEIYDEIGLVFSENFYHHLFKGYSFPEALFFSRKELSERYGEDSLIWGSYTLFAPSPESILEYFFRDREETKKRETLNKNNELSKDNDSNSSENESQKTPILEKENSILEKENRNSNETNRKTIYISITAIIIVAIAVLGFLFRDSFLNSQKQSDSKIEAEKKDLEIKNSKNNTKITYNAVQDSDFLKDDNKNSNLNDSKNVAINGEDNKEKNIKNPNLKTVAILPFDNTSKDKTIEPLKKGFADMLITDLSGISDINVVDREDLEAIFKELNFSETKFIDSKTALKVGKMLSAHYLMTGSFMYMFGKLRIDAKIIKTETGEIVWAKGAEGDLNDIFSLKGKIISQLEASSLLPKKDEKKYKNPTDIAKKIGFEKMGIYFEALNLYDSQKYSEAKTLFEKILSEYPNFDYAKRYIKLIDKK
ncbi:adenylate/guanylate cyclase domain-containing protein [bacterium]|nr:adenylate/guanylate cyclase domain-containing protein [bacterium]